MIYFLKQAFNAAIMLGRNRKYILDAKLVKLPVSASLRPIVSEEITHVEQANRLRQIVHAMLEIRATHGSRSFGAQGDQVSPPVFERVSLLLDNVRGLANTPYKQVGVLERGRINALVSEPSGNVFSPGFEEAPVDLLLREYVTGPSWRLELFLAHFSGLPLRKILHRRRTSQAFQKGYHMYQKPVTVRHLLQIASPLLYGYNRWAAQPPQEVT